MSSLSGLSPICYLTFAPKHIENGVLLLWKLELIHQDSVIKYYKELEALLTPSSPDAFLPCELFKVLCELPWGLCKGTHNHLQICSGQPSLLNLLSLNTWILEASSHLWEGSGAQQSKFSDHSAVRSNYYVLNDWLFFFPGQWKRYSNNYNCSDALSYFYTQDLSS